jgi:hypothetical protein
MTPSMHCDTRTAELNATIHANDVAPSVTQILMAQLSVTTSGNASNPATTPQ